jgi:hypothetical protein
MLELPQTSLKMNRKFGFLAALVLCLGYPCVSVAQLPHRPISARDSIAREIYRLGKAHALRGDPSKPELAIRAFERNSGGLTIVEIDSIYNKAYTRNASPWTIFIPKLGWLISLLLGIILIFRRTLEVWATRAGDVAAQWIQDRFAGSRAVNSWALRRYKAALLERFSELRIPFSARTITMRKIFVPVKLAAGAMTDRINPFRYVSDHFRAVIVGPPGSGKSMLLRQMALLHADDSTEFPGIRCIPIYLELHRFAAHPGKSIREHLTAELARTQFPKAEAFVDQQLRNGSLVLLMDGLDEVSSQQRNTVVELIRDFMDEFPDTRIVVTCRTAVYQGDWIDRAPTLEIQEFTDRQIRKFLHAWEPYMPKEKSVDQLVQTLHDRPTINGLARNPLLLTIIAYLYTDTPHVLPHSRTEFYKQATDVLLHQWHQERNQYEARDKNAVLQHLGLFFENNAINEQDRRSVGYQQVFDEVERILPKLNLSAEADARSLVSEIVERSGLLLSIDRGERYQFAHLTLQEYFAAAKLGDSWESLHQRFESDPDIWRETVKLWCGLGYDSSKLLEQIFRKDPLFAFECLADARQITPETAQIIVQTAEAMFGGSQNDDLLVHAFGVVAADSRPRGVAVLQFLRKKLVSGSPHEQRVAIAALSASNLPGAAEDIAVVYDTFPEARVALTRMGDLAVKVLSRLCAKGNILAHQDLRTIGTPAAALALVDSLWHTNPACATIAAWNLATLLSNQEVEDVLRTVPLAQSRVSGQKFLWIWEPFELDGSRLRITVSRIAELVLHTSDQTLIPTSDGFDTRLAAALICLLCQDGIRVSIRDAGSTGDIVDFVDEFSPALLLDTRHSMRLTHALISAANVNQFTSDQIRIAENMAASVLGHPSIGWKERIILNSQATEMRVRILAAIAQEPSLEHWRDQFSPVQYDSHTGWHTSALRAFFAVVVLYIVIVVCAQIVLGPVSLAPLLVIYVVLAITGYVCFFITGSFKGLIQARDPRSLYNYALLGALTVPRQIVSDVFGRHARSWRTIVEDVQLVACAAWLPMLIYVSFRFVNTDLQVTLLIGFWASLVCVSAVLLFGSHRLEVASRNPFTYLFTI